MSVFARGARGQRSADGPLRRGTIAAVVLVVLVPVAWSASTAPMASPESGVASTSKVTAPPPPREPAASPPAARGTLGRLFFTPEERLAIDNGQLAPVAPAARGPASVDTATASPAAPGVTRVDGFMRRPNAPPVVWVDGEPVESDTSAADSAAGGRSVRLAREGDSVRIRRPDGAALELRPGQSSDSPELGEGNRFEVLK